MANSLEKEFQYYLDNQADLVSQYDGMVLVIKNQQVIGVFDTEIEAIEETKKDEELGTFLVQRCSPGEENHTATFHSRVAFP